MRYLIASAPRFDPKPDGVGPALSEGGHSRNRIVHAGGDASGAEVQRTLDENAAWPPGSRSSSTCLRARPADRDATAPAGARPGWCDRPHRRRGHVLSVGARHAHRAVVLATGGYGQVFARPPTRPPSPATASRSRSGPARRSPTSSSCSSTPPCCGPGRTPRGQQALVTEAVRGEGAVLVRRCRAAGDGRRPPAAGPRAPRRRRRGDQRADGHAPGGVEDHVFLDARRTWARRSAAALPDRHRRPAGRPGSTRPTSGSRSRRRRTSPVAACAADIDGRTA